MATNFLLKASMSFMHFWSFNCFWLFYLCYLFLIDVIIVEIYQCITLLSCIYYITAPKTIQHARSDGLDLAPHFGILCSSFFV